MTGKQEEPKSSRRRLTRREILEIIYDPAIQAELEKDPHVVRRKALYAENASGLLGELAEAGFAVGSVGELVRKHADFRPVVPILVKWLHRVHYLPLAEDIVRALSVRFAKAEVVPTLLKMFRDPPDVTDPMRPAHAPKSAKSICAG